MAKFKKGDKVRISDNLERDNKNTCVVSDMISMQGMIGKIIDVMLDSESGRLKAKVSVSGITWWYDEQALTKIESEGDGNMYSSIDRAQHTIRIDGKNYDYHNEFEYVGSYEGRQKPYLRLPTRVNLLKELKRREPDVFDDIKTYGWYIYNYKDKVEGTEQPTQETGVRNGEINMNSEVLEKLTKAIEGISDRKILEFDKQQTKEFISETLDKLVKDRLLIPNQTIEIKKLDEIRKVEGLTHKIFPTCVKLLGAHKNVFITGPAGTGKNHMCAQLAKALGVDFDMQGKISIGHEFELTGYMDANGKFVEPLLYKALKKEGGSLFFFDEFDASSPDAAVQMNSLLANGYLTFANSETVHMNDNFYVICAGNTMGTGADMIYTGRNVIDGATLDRFVLVHMDYDTNLETALCPDDELKQFIYDIRKSAKKNNVNAIVGMRCLINAYDLEQIGMDKQDIVWSAIVKAMGQDDINILKNDMDSSNSWYPYFKAYQD